MSIYQKRSSTTLYTGFGLNLSLKLIVHIFDSQDTRYLKAVTKDPTINCPFHQPIDQVCGCPVLVDVNIHSLLHVYAEAK